MTKRATIEDVKQSFPVEDHWRILEYLPNNGKQKLRFICKGCKAEVTEEWRARSLKNLRCKNCNQSDAAKERIASGVSKTFGENCRKFDTEAVRSIFLECGATPTFDKYQGPGQQLSFICSTPGCGQPGSMTFRNLYYKDPRCTELTIPRCKACNLVLRRETGLARLPHPTGEDHPGWKFWLTDEERAANESRGPEFIKWARAVKERDNFTCQVSGSRGVILNAHHLNNWADFPEKRFDLANGVTLSEEIHNRFHFLYGRISNTAEQFNAFRERCN